MMQIALGQVHAYSAKMDHQQKSTDAVLVTAPKLLEEVQTIAAIQVRVRDIEYQINIIFSKLITLNHKIANN